MTNAIVRPAATGLPIPTRRLFLAAGSAAAVFATVKRAAGSTDSADPIFAAIERHKEAWRAFDTACSRTDNVVAEEEGREVTEADEAAWSASNAFEEEVFEALVTLPPETVAGMRAVIEYFVDFELDIIQGGPAKFLSALLQSPLLAEGGANV
jgi:hypothetical protein